MSDKSQAVCPMCGNEPTGVSHQLANKQEHCSNSDCPVISWNNSVKYDQS